MIALSVITYIESMINVFEPEVIKQAAVVNIYKE